MNIKTVISKITDRWPAKIICFALAIILYVFHQTTKVERRTIVVPLEIIQEGNVTYMGNIAKSVSILIRAKDEDINTIMPSEISASLNLNPIVDSGVCEVPIDISLSDRLLAMDPLEIKVKPDKITVRADERVIKYVEVRPQIVEEVAYGYKIEKVICDPPFVEIMGPKSIVSNIDHVSTKRIPASNASASFSTETSYYELNKLIDVPYKGPYKVTVAVLPELITQTFKDIPVKPVNLSENLQISEMTKSVSVTVEGTVVFLERYSLPMNAIVVNLSEITEAGTYELPLVSHISNSLTIKEISNEKISVTVIEAKKEEPVDSIFENSKSESENNTDASTSTKTNADGAVEVNSEKSSVKNSEKS